MNNNTKIRLRLSKNLFESLTREILAEAKVNDGYSVAVKQPKTPKQSKSQATSPEVQKTDKEKTEGLDPANIGPGGVVVDDDNWHQNGKKEAAPTPTGNSASKLGADMIEKGRKLKGTPGLSSQEIKTIQSILDLIVNKAPEGETALALQKALTILTQNTKNIEDKGQPGSTTSLSAMNAAGHGDKPAIPGLKEKKMKEMETKVAENTLKEYEHHYEIVNGQCRRYNDEGEYEVVDMQDCR
jgi:hypothetical protein